MINTKAIIIPTGVVGLLGLSGDKLQALSFNLNYNRAFLCGNNKLVFVKDHKQLAFVEAGHLVVQVKQMHLNHCQTTTLKHHPNVPNTPYSIPETLNFTKPKLMSGSGIPRFHLSTLGVCFVALRCSNIFNPAFVTRESHLSQGNKNLAFVRNLHFMLGKSKTTTRKQGTELRHAFYTLRLKPRNLLGGKRD